MKGEREHEQTGMGHFPGEHYPEAFLGRESDHQKRQLDIPPDRQSFLAEGEKRKEEFVNWINKVLIPYLDTRVAAGDTKHIECHNGDESFRCMAEDRDSGGYLYIGAYSV